MGELKTNVEFNLDTFWNDSTDETSSISSTEEVSNNDEKSTSIVEYKEIEEPCVALTIIGENRLTDTEVFVRRGIRYSIKAFFSTLILTIMNMFI